MIPKRNRLPIPEFRNQRTRVIKTDLFGARWIPNELGFNRFAILISGKIIPLSVNRHLFKRKIASILEKWPNLSVDLSISGLAPLKNAKFSDINSAIIVIYDIIKKDKK
jgi:hypothetical protein